MLLQLESTRKPPALTLIVVLGFEADALISMVSRDDVEPIVNARWRDGDAGSLRTGAAAVPRDTDTAIIARLEQPRPASVYRMLLEEHPRRRAAITRPSSAGAPGAPIVAGHEALAPIRNAAGPGDALGRVIERRAGGGVDVRFETDIVLLTIRTAEDYERAREALRARQ